MTKQDRARIQSFRIAEEALFRIALGAPLGSYAQAEALQALTAIRNALRL